MFAHIFRFEMNYHARQPLVYVVSAVLFFLSFLATVSDNIGIGGTVSNININSPFNVIVVLASISFLSALIAGVAYASSPILRDFDHKVAELFFTSRVSKFDYLMGRFCGATIFSFVVYFAAASGVFLGELMPWLDPERIGPMRLDAYWFATWAIAIPNMLMISTLVFLVATLTRSLMASYVVIILVLIVSSIITSIFDPEDLQLLSLLDPFGQVAITDITRYWTPFEMNELVVPMEGNLLYNRLLTGVLSLLFIALAYRYFPFSLEFVKPKSKWFARFRRSPKQRSDNPAPARTSIAQLNGVNKSFDFRAQIAQFASLIRIEFHNIIIGKAFLVMALMGMVQIGATAFLGLAGIFGTEVYPTTSAMLLIVNSVYSIPIIVVLVFYSSELLVRDRNVGVSEMLDSMPYPNWVIIGAKLVGLMAVMFVMLLAAMLAAVLIQIFKGYYDFNFSQYFFGLFSFFQFPIWFTCVLAVFAQVVTGNRYLGMFVVVMYFAGTLFLPQQGFDHNLYLLSTPGIPYSVFTGFGPNLSAFVWFSIYWTLFCALLLIVMHLLWQRGSELKGRFRWKNIKPRFSTPVAIAAAICLLAFAGTGRFIFYNTNVLNSKLSSLDVEEGFADYEKAYKQYEDLNFPDIMSLYTEVDIFPEDREAHIEGIYTLTNNYDVVIPEFHFTVATYLTINELNVPNSTLSHSDADLGYYIYQLDRPMQPGESLDVNFDIDWLTPGFVNNSPTTSLLSSGTFFNNTEAFPLGGYNKGAELLDNNRRRRYDLPPVERVAKIDDESQWDVGLGTRMRANYEAIVSTSSDQIAVTPGYLEREWEEDGRRYYHYKMDEPIWPFVSFLSADYEMKSDKWNDVDLEVYYKHEQNVDRMLEASKKSLDYFTANFSPYQYRQYRIFEFPRQRGVFAQSFPNTIPFSEAIGFVADLRDPEAIDYVFYVTAHEFAHQWWGHQVVGANVQGAAVLTETLSQYSALMVMEKEYGAAHMQRFLKYELDNYLNSRGAEVLEELPLMLVENQGYIHYRKGSLVLYALKDYLGEDTVNLILREFIADWGFKGPPYPTTRHLLAKIRENALPEYQDIITDLFEKIVLYDLRAEDSHYTELSDGRFEVTINTAASKFEANGQGEETQVAMNALIDIAVLGEEDEETKVPEILHIEKQRVDSENQTFVFVVDSRPVSVGIDPLNKLIDRNPDDNTKSVDVLN
ncbi:MAG: ABC-2 type transport system permease protein [Kiritimatiellia bacterium]|jgi:ABC-2 type transport system permease protein